MGPKLSNEMRGEISPLVRGERTHNPQLPFLF